MQSESFYISKGVEIAILFPKLSFLPVYILLYNGILVSDHFDRHFEASSHYSNVKNHYFTEFQTNLKSLYEYVLLELIVIAHLHLISNCNI